MPEIPAAVPTKDYSVVVGTTSMQVLDQTAFTQRVRFMRLRNVTNGGPGVGATIWLSRAGPAAVGAAGSWPLASGEKEEWIDTAMVPTNNLWAISSAVGGQLTVEIG